MKTNEQTLKPCPFCGGSAVSTYKTDDHTGLRKYSVFCTGLCGGNSGEKGEIEADAIAVWNRRARPPAASEAGAVPVELSYSLIRKHLGKNAADFLCTTYWKDGIDIQEPMPGLESLIAEFRAPPVEAGAVVTEVAERRTAEVSAMEVADKDGRYLNAQGHQQAIDAIDFCVSKITAAPSDAPAQEDNGAESRCWSCRKQYTEHSLMQADGHCPHCDVEIEAIAAPAAQGDERAGLPMGSAPRDGTLIRLLVKFDEHQMEDHDEPQWTIGQNSFENTQDDRWQFVGWSWSHDCFTDSEGEPIAWLPLVARAALSRQPSADTAVPADCDVRKILLRVVPGDGNGHEVYAKNGADVESLLSEMGAKLEAFELARNAAFGQPSAPASAERIRIDYLSPAKVRGRLDGSTWRFDDLGLSLYANDVACAALAAAKLEGQNTQWEAVARLTMRASPHPVSNPSAEWCDGYAEWHARALNVSKQGGKHAASA